MSQSVELPDAHHNQLLSALSAEEYQRLLPLLQPVTFSLGEVLQAVRPAARRAMATVS